MTALAMPHFINYPGSVATPISGPIPPVTVPITQLGGNVPLANANGTNAYGTVSVPTVQVPVVPVGGGCYNDGMEVVWHGEFSRLFSNFFPPHVWYLTITNQAPQQKWKFHRDSAKVRFCCQDCGNGWTSMKGRVTFWFYLDYERNSGFVQFKLYGQQCKKCNTGKFEYVMWYPEEVSKVMCNVYHKVGQTYYGFLQPPIRIDRRPGRPRNQHNAELCQACRDGECDQARPIKPLFTVNNNVIPSPLSVVAPVSDSSVRCLNPVSSSSPSSLSSESSASSVTVTSQSNTPSTSAPDSVANPTPATQTSNVNYSNYITPPVTISAGVQPVIAYSVVGAPPKNTTLTVSSNQFFTSNPPMPPVSGHYIYHPNPIMSGAIPIHPSAVFPVLPPKQIIRNDMKAQVPPTTVLTLSNRFEATSLYNNVETRDQEKPDPQGATATSNEDEESLDKTKRVENPAPPVKVES